MAHDTATAAFIAALKADVATMRKLYHSAAEVGNKPAMHRLEAALAGTFKLLALYGESAN